MMLGVVVAEQTGLINALLRGGVTRVPAKYMTFTVALVGICGGVAGDAAYVVLITYGSGSGASSSMGSSTMGT